MVASTIHQENTMSVPTRNSLAVAAALAACGAIHTAAAAPVAYRTVAVDGVQIAYREAGAGNRPTLLLLHGVPSSSRMYDALMRKLGDRYHLIAPDYPGFGNSDAPDPKAFVYTFDHLADVTQKFADTLGLQRYVLMMQDYGAPVGMRMALKRPGAVQGMVFQNGNVYEDGLGPMWAQRKAFWSDRAAHEQEVLAKHQSVAVTRARHLGSDPDVTAYDPDLWMDEYAYLNRPGQGPIQAELIYDYQHNLTAYPAWQAWLRQHQLPTLVVWGKHDPAFLVPGALAFKRDLPKAQVEILDAGHFAMDTRLEQVATLVDGFLQANRQQLAKPAAR
jgi:pimeloyl-ACP methyl ester carboxylesterase